MLYCDIYSFNTYKYCKELFRQSILIYAKIQDENFIYEFYVLCNVKETFKYIKYIQIKIYIYQDVHNIFNIFNICTS